MAGEEGDVVAPLAQGRHVEGDDVEAEVEVLAERPPADLVLELLVGGRDHPHVHGHRGGAAHRLDLLLLEGAQDLGLGLQGHVPHLVEEQGAPVGQLELALARGQGPGERALGVAEELALDEVLGDGGAVHLDEGARGAAALVVDVAGHELLARAVLAEDEPSTVAGGGLGDLGAEPVQGRALPHHDEALLDLLLERAVLHLQAPRPQGVLDHEQGLLEGEGLLHEVLRAHAHGLHRGLDVAVTRDHDHRHLGIEDAQAGEGLEAVQAGQPHVEEHEVVTAPLEGGEAGLPALHRLHLVALVAEDPPQGGPHPALVVHDQDLFAHALLGSGPQYSAFSIRTGPS